MKVIVAFSGGKDSQACLIQACREYGVKNVEAVFCDTGWEHHLTYKHINDVVSSLGVRLVVLKSDVGGFEGLCKRMKAFPSPRVRVCTLQLKIQPMIDYVLNQNESLVIVQGIRAAESSARSKLPCSANYFKDYLDDSYKGKLYRKRDVVDWCSRHSATVERPMLSMSAQGIIDYILSAGMQPNPLYRRGAARVGCYPCIYARLSEVKCMRGDEQYVNRLIALEDSVNKLRTSGEPPATFFPIGKIPSRFCSKYGHGIPAVEDVVRYVGRDDAQLDLFEPDGGYSCMSVYHGLCE